MDGPRGAQGDSYTVLCMAQGVHYLQFRGIIFGRTIYSTTGLKPRGYYEDILGSHNNEKKSRLASEIYIHKIQYNIIDHLQRRRR